MSYLSIGKLLIKGASKTSIAKKYGKKALDKFFERYGSNPNKWLKEGMAPPAASLPAIMGIDVISRKSNKSKPKKTKYNPRLKVKKNK